MASADSTTGTQQGRSVQRIMEEVDFVRGTWANEYGDTEMTYAYRVGDDDYVLRWETVVHFDAAWASLSLTTKKIISDWNPKASRDQKLRFLLALPSSRTGELPEHVAARNSGSSSMPIHFKLTRLTRLARRDLFSTHDGSGATVLHILVERHEGNKCPSRCPLVRVLRWFYNSRSRRKYVRDTDVKIRSARKDERLTPLQLAVRLGKPAVVGKLFKYGALIRARDLHDLLNLWQKRDTCDVKLRNVRNVACEEVGTLEMLRIKRLLTLEYVKTQPSLVVQLALLYPQIAHHVAGTLQGAPNVVLRAVARAMRSYSSYSSTEAVLYALWRWPKVASLLSKENIPRWSSCKRWAAVDSDSDDDDGTYTTPSDSGNDEDGDDARRAAASAAGNRYKTLRSACLSVTADRIAGLRNVTCAMRVLCAGLTEHNAPLVALVGGPQFVQCVTSILPHKLHLARSAALVRDMVIAAAATERIGTRAICEGAGMGAAGGVCKERVPEYSVLCRLPRLARHRVVVFYTGLDCSVFFRCCGAV